MGLKEGSKATSQHQRKESLTPSQDALATYRNLTEELSRSLEDVVSFWEPKENRYLKLENVFDLASRIRDSLYKHLHQDRNISTFYFSLSKIQNESVLLDGHNIGYDIHEAAGRLFRYFEIKKTKTNVFKREVNYNSDIPYKFMTGNFLRNFSRQLKDNFEEKLGKQRMITWGTPEIKSLMFKQLGEEVPLYWRVITYFTPGNKEAGEVYQYDLVGENHIPSKKKVEAMAEKYIRDYEDELEAKRVAHINQYQDSRNLDHFRNNSGYRVSEHYGSDTTVYVEETGETYYFNPQTGRRRTGYEYD